MSEDPHPAGRILSVQVALPSFSLRRGSERVYSGFLKRPVEGPVAVGPGGLAGDGVGNPEVHGGATKAVYAYPSEHYPRWRTERPELSFDYGGFGENLTTEGWLEPDLRPGDQLSAGSAVFEVTKPRFPCEKLGLRFQRPTMVKEFGRSGRSGFYLGIVRTGELRAGDRVVRKARGPPGPTIDELTRDKFGRD